MMNELLPILQVPAVSGRVSAATRAVLEARALPEPYQRCLDDENYNTLREVLAVLLPQDAIGTEVDLAEAIDRRLAKGENSGWRYADLPPDADAYRQGLAAMRRALHATPLKGLGAMPVAGREAFLRCAAEGDVDAAAHFPVSTFLRMLRADAVRMWMAHPSTMHALSLYGFADGATGMTDGPTADEGWSELTPDTAKAFEQGASPMGREA